MRTRLRLGVPGGIVAGCLLLPAATAWAQEPDRTGWWNRVSAGGVAAPLPTTAEGDLRIANAPDGPAAFAAVLYSVFGSTDATLALQVRADRTVGTPDVVACATVDTEWKEGGNQPYDAAPAYDCALGSSQGELAPDGSTLTFLLDSTTQDATGAWSLALVPAPGSTAPFHLELAAPGEEAFAAGPSSSEQEPFVSSEPEPFEQDPGSGGGSDEAFLPGAGFGAPPAFDAGTAEQPLLAGGADAALPGAEPATPQPALAGGPAANGPVLMTQPAGVVEDVSSGRRLLALLVLAGGSAAVGYAAGQQQPGPRLIGGRARGATPPAGAAPALPGEERPRGIGRFAKERTAAPRRLR